MATLAVKAAPNAIRTPGVIGNSAKVAPVTRIDSPVAH